MALRSITGWAVLRGTGIPLLEPQTNQTTLLVFASQEEAFNEAGAGDRVGPCEIRYDTDKAVKVEELQPGTLEPRPDTIVNGVELSRILTERPVILTVYALEVGQPGG